MPAGWKYVMIPRRRAVSAIEPWIAAPICFIRHNFIGSDMRKSLIAASLLLALGIVGRAVPVRRRS